MVDSFSCFQQIQKNLQPVGKAFISNDRNWLAVVIVTLESSKTMGGIGALLMLISPLSGFAVGGFGGLLGLVGIILVLIAMSGLAGYYKESGIFNNTLYGVIATIVGVVIFGVTLVIAAVSLFTDLGLTWSELATDPSAFSGMDWQALINIDTILGHVAVILAAFVVLFVFAIISALFYRKSLTILAEKTGVGLFGTTGMLFLVGAILIILFGIGLLLIWVALLLLTVAFFQIKPEPAQPTPTT